jgi:hypothetical protein
MIFWRTERHAIEVKLRHDTETEAEALEQIGHNLDRAVLPEGWLVMVDLRKELSWAEKTFVHELDHAGKKIRLVGC